MRRLNGRARRAGFTLVELLIAITIAGLVMGVVYRVLLSNQRFYRAQSQILEVQQNVRAVAQILPGELRELDAADGDIIAMSATAMTIKAARGFTVVCAPPDVANGRITVRGALTYGYRAMDATRDSVLVFREGDTQTGGDDRWLRAPIAGIASASCPGGAAGTRLTLTGMVGGTGQLDSVTDGSPVRTFEVVNYLLYNDGSGTWWLGVRGFSGGAWGATSPVAGPLRASDGLAFQYLDGSGNVTGTAANVREVLLTVRGRSIQSINVPGRAVGQYQDSTVTRVFLRNNARY